MRKNIAILIYFCLINFASSEMLYVVENDTEVFDSKGKNKIGITFKGMGGEKVRELEDKVVLKFQGFIDKNNASILYTTPSLSSPLVIFDQSIKLNVIEVAIPKEKLSQDQYELWSETKKAYYNKCAVCHMLNSPEKYSVLQWEGIFNTMKNLVTINDLESKQILDYLRMHASDGYILTNKEIK